MRSKLWPKILREVLFRLFLLEVENCELEDKMKDILKNSCYTCTGEMFFFILWKHTKLVFFVWKKGVFVIFVRNLSTKITNESQFST